MPRVAREEEKRSSCEVKGGRLDAGAAVDDCIYLVENKERKPKLLCRPRLWAEETV